MVDVRQPIKTEYRGITFRSKSEAIVALYLNEVAQSLYEDKIRFMYEPGFVTRGDGEWIPDFIAWEVVNYSDEETDCERGIEFSLIEYKPVMPTGAYLRKLIEDMRLWKNRVSKLFVVRCELWYGGCYETLPARMMLDTVSGNWSGYRTWNWWPQVPADDFGMWQPKSWDDNWDGDWTDKPVNDVVEFLRSYRFDLPARRNKELTW